MRERVADVLAALYGPALVFALAAWLVATIATVGIAALVVVNLPATYFVAEAPWRIAPRGAGAWARRLARNALGVALILVGAALSLPGVPGQGVLTMLIGAMLVDFPGRRRLERWLVRRRGVLTTLNGLRARWGKPPLLPPAA